MPVQLRSDKGDKIAWAIREKPAAWNDKKTQAQKDIDQILRSQFVQRAR